jgi:hypothetical protein
MCCCLDGILETLSILVCIALSMIIAVGLGGCYTSNLSGSGTFCGVVCDASGDKACVSKPYSAAPSEGKAIHYRKIMIYYRTYLV